MKSRAGSTDDRKGILFNYDHKCPNDVKYSGK